MTMESALSSELLSSTIHSQRILVHAEETIFEKHCNTGSSNKSTTGSLDAIPKLSKAATQDHQTLSSKASGALRLKVITGQDTDQKKVVPIEAESVTSCVTLIQLGTATHHE